MGRGCWDIGFKDVVRLSCVALMLLGLAGPLALAQEAASEPASTEPTSAEAAPAEPASAPAQADADAKAIEENFSAYLHFALIGEFDKADNYAQALLEQPGLDPLSKTGAEAIVAFTDEYKDSIETLLVIINNTSIAENGRKVLSIVREAHRFQRMKPGRINESIQFLTGSPTERATGLTRLLDSGEYAVPWLLEILADVRQKEIHPFVVRVLPQLGKRIVNPMVQALAIDDAVVQRYAAEALGKLGYPQALPYLKKLVEDSKTNEEVRAAADQAIKAIVAANPGVAEMASAEMFAVLAGQYYDGRDALLPATSEEQVNVWYAKDGTVKPIAVPEDIYMLVMCMRCCEASLELAKDQPGTVALWLAANFRREAALGLNVEDEQVVETADKTRSADFLRGLYFARSAGPMYCQLVLQRGLKDKDRNVVLGAIAALDVTAGPAIMVDTAGDGGRSLAKGLMFPDLLVRIRSALALAKAMPAEDFRGADDVLPVLAAAVSLEGHKQYLLLDPDAKTREALKPGLAGEGDRVFADNNFSNLLTYARKNLAHLDGVFVAADMKSPSPVEVMAQLARDDRFALTPVVVYVKKGSDEVALRVAAADDRAGVVTLDETITADSAQELLATLSQTAGRYGSGQIDAELGATLALESAKVLRDLAICGKDVFNISLAVPALVEALHRPAEPLRLASIAVLARVKSKEAQEAIAVLALDDAQEKPIRQAAFDGLAESARQFGCLMSEALTGKLTAQAFEGEDLELRTAASKALGAVNLPSAKVAEIILSQG